MPVLYSKGETVDLDGKGGGEDFGETGEGEAVVNILCGKKAWFQ